MGAEPSQQPACKHMVHVNPGSVWQRNLWLADHCSSFCSTRFPACGTMCDSSLSAKQSFVEPPLPACPVFRGQLTTLLTAVASSPSLQRFDFPGLQAEPGYPLRLARLPTWVTDLLRLAGLSLLHFESPQGWHLQHWSRLSQSQLETWSLGACLPKCSGIICRQSRW